MRYLFVLLALVAFAACESGKQRAGKLKLQNFYLYNFHTLKNLARAL